MMQEILARCRSLRSDSFPGTVESIVIGGSIGRQEGDVLSDIDLFVWVDGLRVEDASVIAGSIAWQLGHVRMCRGPVWIDDFGYSFSYLYDGLTVCQVNVNDTRTARPHPIRRQASFVVYDRNGWYRRHRETCMEMHVSEQQVFQNAVTLGSFRAISVCRSLLRNDLWFAIQHLGEVRDQLFTIARLESAMPPPGLLMRAPSKSIEKDVGTDIRAIVNTLPEYSLVSVAACLMNALRHLSSAADNYARRSGATADLQLIERLATLHSELQRQLVAYLPEQRGLPK